VNFVHLFWRILDKFKKRGGALFSYEVECLILNLIVKEVNISDAL